MLIVHRHVGESVDLFTEAGHVSVKVLQLDVHQGQGRAHIGIEAPRSIEIVREELLPLDMQYWIRAQRGTTVSVSRKGQRTS